MDAGLIPDATQPSAVGLSDDRLVRRWLVATLVAVLATLVVGGITRLTESGLSITEWQPVTGALPPLSDVAWQDAFERYQRIPEAQTVHAGLTLAQFKTLYWWEWIHRNLARLVGLVIALPYFVLLARRRLRGQHRLRLLMLPILTGLQGALGWYMVRSGLTERTDVSPYRLVAHLALALVIYLIALWTLLDLGPRPSRAPDAPPPPSNASAQWAFALTGLATLTILSGGFVAGLDAGHMFNTFPLMGGQFVPAGYGSIEGWRNAFENPIAAQFHHRLLGIVTLAAVLIGWWHLRSRLEDTRPSANGVRDDGVSRAATLAVAAAFLQVGLGIATLVLKVPITLAALHQLCAVALLSALLVAAHRARPGESSAAA
jgi:cytochrome c oxidase assembly protein subunit 15